MSHPTPEALAARYGNPYQKAERIEISPERFEHGVERGDDGSWGVGALVVDDGRALFVREGDTWLLPGGRAQSGESLEIGAVREIHEETGITIDIVGLGAIAEQTFVHERTGDSYEFHFATFIGNPRDADLAGNPEERDESVDEAAWRDSVPESTFDRELVAHLFHKYV